MTKRLLIPVLALLVFYTPAFSQDRLPPRMVQDIECFKRLGLIQGTVTEVMRGDAHFAVFFKDLKIGGKGPTIRFNGAFVEGRTSISPTVVKECNPNVALEKNPN